jgi:hypothetical protein
MTVPDPDRLDRTVLIAVHDGTAPTIEAAEAAHAATGVVLIADDAVCVSTNGQAALLTAVTTAVRAFGNVHVVLATPGEIIRAGVNNGTALQEAVKAEGANPITAEDVLLISRAWPIVLIGATTAVPPRSAGCAPTLRVRWTSWTVIVEPARPPTTLGMHDNACVLSAIAGGALAVSEAFNIVLARGGSDAGHRPIALNLWKPGTTENGPDLRYAPAHWWLVGLGHLGQAYSWVLSWLEYEQPSQVQVVLQDTDRTTAANHSTGMLTPVDSRGERKTRLVAASLDRIGYDTHIIERRIDTSTVLTPADIHVALLGVDNLAARRLISQIGWRLAIDAGLGAGPSNFSSIMVRRFPGRTTSTDVPGWADSALAPMIVPNSPAFDDLRRRTDTCGLAELAGKAVGASFVGAVAGTLAVSEAVRELHGGVGADITTISLDTLELVRTSATADANVIALPLKPSVLRSNDGC